MARFIEDVVFNILRLVIVVVAYSAFATLLTLAITH